MEILSAIMLGLLGSFHCAGMCGPIALALPLRNDSWLHRISSGLTYNFGRLLTYSLLGIVFGLIGQGFALGGMQQVVSIVIGSIMILSVIFPVAFSKLKIDSANYRVVAKLKSAFARMFGIRSYSSLFAIGLLNGFLPCGLVYIALAGAVVSGSMTGGAVYMAVFGLGTIPIMLGISLLSNVATLRVRNRIRKVIPYVIVIIGILFILRGMNLGVPYLSPKLDTENKAGMECCH